MPSAIFQGTDLRTTCNWLLFSWLMRQMDTALEVHCCYTYRWASKAKKVHSIFFGEEENGHFAVGWIHNKWLQFFPYQWYPKSKLSWLANSAGGEFSSSPPSLSPFHSSHTQLQQALFSSCHIQLQFPTVSPVKSKLPLCLPRPSLFPTSSIISNCLVFSSQPKQFACLLYSHVCTSPLFLA